MPEQVQRGFVPTDAVEFGPKWMERLQKAQGELCFLLDRGYEIEKTVTFVGNHYQLSARQRTALTRASAAGADLRGRVARRLTGKLTGRTVHIDGFNLIITLEAALSETTLLRCMDGTVRDLCGLHGTYRLIDKTDAALGLVGQRLGELEIARAVLCLDAPVSNSGRLGQRFRELCGGYGFEVEIEMVPNADAILWDKECVVSSDAIILNRCGGWVNLAAELVERAMPVRACVDLSMRGGLPV